MLDRVGKTLARNSAWFGDCYVGLLACGCKRAESQSFGNNEPGRKLDGCRARPVPGGIGGDVRAMPYASRHERQAGPKQMAGRSSSPVDAGAVAIDLASACTAHRRNSSRKRCRHGQAAHDGDMDQRRTSALSDDALSHERSRRPRRDCVSQNAERVEVGLSLQSRATRRESGARTGTGSGLQARDSQFLLG